MATKVASLYAEIGADTTGLKKGLTEAKTGLNDVKQSANQAQSPLRGIKSGFSAISVAGAGVVAAGFAIKKAFDFANEQAQIQYTRQKFDNLAASIGTTSDVLLGQLRQATHGTVSDLGLVSSATDYLSLGLVKTADQAVRLTRVAGALGMDMNQLTLTLTNQTTMRFDSLGLSVAGFQDRLNKLKAAGMDVNSAFTEAFLQQAEDQIKKVGDISDTSAGKVKKFASAWSNYMQELKSGQGGGLVGALINVQGTAGGLLQTMTELRKEVDKGTISMGEARKELLKYILTGKTDEQQTQAITTATQGAISAHEQWRLSTKQVNESLNEQRKLAEKAGSGINDYSQDLADIPTDIPKLDVKQQLQALDALKQHYDGIVMSQDKVSKGMVGQEIISEAEALFKGKKITVEEYERIVGQARVKYLGWTGDEAQAANKMFDTFQKLHDQGPGAIQAVESEADNLLAKMHLLTDHDWSVNIQLTTTGDVPSLGGPKKSTQGTTVTTGNPGTTTGGNRVGGPQEYATGTGGWLTVPPGYSNDSYMIGMSSGEHFNVRAPGQGGGGGDVIMGDIVINAPQVADPLAVASLAANMIGNRVRQAMNSGLAHAG